jgi:hypothetical protein
MTDIEIQDLADFNNNSQDSLRIIDYDDDNDENHERDINSNFNKLTQLSTLIINLNLHFIPETIFSLTALTELHLNNNKLTEIPASINRLTSLRILNFVNNEISTLPEEGFILPELIELNLSRNALTTLPANAFNRLVNLESLILTNNRLTTLQAGLFTGLNRLTTLNLSVNRLTTLQDGLFTGLNRLINLNLSHNLLTTIQAGLFTGLNNLLFLNLSHNLLTTIQAGSFTGLERTNLLLNDNEISSLPNDFFQGFLINERIELNNNLLSPDNLKRLGFRRLPPQRQPIMKPIIKSDEIDIDTTPKFMVFYLKNTYFLQLFNQAPILFDKHDIICRQLNTVNVVNNIDMVINNNIVINFKWCKLPHIYLNDTIPTSDIIGTIENKFHESLGLIGIEIENNDEMHVHFICSRITKKNIGSIIFKKINIISQKLGLKRISLDSLLNAVPFYTKIGFGFSGVGSVNAMVKKVSSPPSHKSSTRVRSYTKSKKRNTKRKNTNTKRKNTKRKLTKRKYKSL